jgi:hypothetical protein
VDYTSLQGSASAFTPDPSPCTSLCGDKSPGGKSPSEKGGSSSCVLKCIPKLSRTIEEGCNVDKVSTCLGPVPVFLVPSLPNALLLLPTLRLGLRTLPLLYHNQPSSSSSSSCAYSLVLEPFGPAKWKCAAFPRSSLGNVNVVEVAQVFDEVVTAREALVAHAVAAGDCAGKFGSTHAMDGGLVALQVGKTCKVCRGYAAGYVTCPGPGCRVSDLVNSSFFQRARDG